MSKRSKEMKRGAVNPKKKKNFTRAGIKGKQIGAMVGNYVSGGNPIAAAVAAAIGKRVGKHVGRRSSEMRGVGSYSRPSTIGSNTATNDLIQGRNVTDPTPRFRGSKKSHDQVITFEEQMIKIVSPSNPQDFNVTVVEINPGLQSTFPKSSQMAVLFTYYDYIQLAFTLKSLLTSFSNTGSMGLIAMVFVPNATNVTFQSMQELIDYDGSVNARVCDHCVLGVECNPKRDPVSNNLFVRWADPSPGSSNQNDKLTYDKGKLYIATEGLSATNFPAGTILAYLNVSAKLRLFDMRLTSELAYTQRQDIFYCKSTTDVAKYYILGNPGYDSQGTYYASSANTLGAWIDCDTTSSNGGNFIKFPDNFQGYINLCTFIDTSISLSGLTLALGGQVSNVNIYKDASGTYSSGSACVSSTKAQQQYTFRIKSALTPGGNYIKISCSNNAAIDATVYITTFNAWNQANRKYINVQYGTPPGGSYALDDGMIDGDVRVPDDGTLMYMDHEDTVSVSSNKSFGRQQRR